MGLSRVKKRAWYARVAVLVSVLLTAGLLLPGGAGPTRPGEPT
jgi:hypothetical protein